MISEYDICQLPGTAFYWKYTYNKWNDAKAKIIDLSSCDPYRTYIFRGQRESSWKIETSLERVPGSMSDHVEEIMRLTFKRGIGAYTSRHFKSNFEYFEMMQHYGAPTRLLDCTMSPYVAAYFAFEQPKTDSSKSKYVSIWMIKGGWLSTHNNQIYKGNKDLLKISTSHLWNLANHRNLDGFFKDKIKGILPQFPSCMDSRMIAQQSVFLIPTTIEIPFENILEVYYEDLNETLPPPIVRIDIADEARQDAIEDLTLMSINAGTMYPGLDGFAKSFQWQYELDMRRDNL